MVWKVRDVNDRIAIGELLRYTERSLACRNFRH